MIEVCNTINRGIRTVSKDINFEKFQEANDMHIEEVKVVMYELSRIIDNRCERHHFAI